MFSYEENEKIVNKAIRKCICESHEKQFVDFDRKTKTLNHADIVIMWEKLSMGAKY